MMARASPAGLGARFLHRSTRPCRIGAPLTILSARTERMQIDNCARGRLFRLSRGRLLLTSDRQAFRLRRTRSPGAAELTATQAARKVGVVEPGVKRAGKPAGPEHTGMAVGYEVTERHKPDQPPLHLPGVGL